MSMELSLHEVSQAGQIRLVAANVPYNNLQWTRRASKPGEFSALIPGGLPVPWPGRYLVTVEGQREVGVLEKVETPEESDGVATTLAGRFAEALWARWEAPAGGASAKGANWRQAVTAALSAWHMPDLPPLKLGEGTEAATGASYSLNAKAGDSAAEAIYRVCEGNGARPVVSYDRAKAPGSLDVSLVQGLDRTRGQRERPVWAFSLGMGTAYGVSYSGDYSVACSEVAAYAEKDDAVTSATAPVPGFDASAQWMARTVEDVGSLAGDSPTAESVKSAGALRAYDHRPDVAIDADVSGAGYGTEWDLGDMVEVEVPSVGLAGAERVEEVRIVCKEGGVTVEASLGTKHISKIARASRR